MRGIATLAAATLAVAALAVVACGRTSPPPASARAPRNVLLITIDTLRADHVGAYGYSRARTPALDGLARHGVLFERAYAVAPITLPSHATILTGRYPPGHGARDNGMQVSAAVPTLATELRARGFRTGAFIAAFPLDHQFGLGRGFDVYGDRLPRQPDGRPANERPAVDVVNDAWAWLATTGNAPFFLWVHLFEPHAPYGHGGPANAARPVIERYDEEIATADREIGRLLSALGPRTADTLIVAAGDHGEAFGEHGEFAHSIFVYDTTLRVPLVMAVPGLAATGVRVREPVSLADVAPTVMRLVGGDLKDVDGLDLGPLLTGGTVPRRELYAESFAPLVEFGWAPLRSIRSGGWKYIAAPRAELYNVERDATETADVVKAEAAVARGLDERVSKYAGPALPRGLLAPPDPEAAARLRALGYTTASSPGAAAGDRPDPKDRRALAARIAQVTSGELSGQALVSALESIVGDDPRNGQAHLRLGYARLDDGDCQRAEKEFGAAIATGLPSADAHLGLATCLGRRNDLAGAERALAEARRLEPGSAVVAANIGILQAARGNLSGAIQSLQRALATDPGLDQARFNLAIALARSGRRADAAAAARELLARLPAGAPERAEVERLLRSLQ